MFANLVNRVKQVICTGAQLVRNQILARTKPKHTSLVLGSLSDLVCTKPQLIAENALLRQQLIVLNRSVKRPRLTASDRSLLVLLASRVRTWKSALLIVQPDTLLRWHRQGYRLFWRRKSRSGARAPRIPAETIALIKDMAVSNRLWGVKRIQGELLKVGIKVSKRSLTQHQLYACVHFHMAEKGTLIDGNSPASSSSARIPGRSLDDVRRIVSATTNESHVQRTL